MTIFDTCEPSTKQPTRKGVTIQVPICQFCNDLEYFESDCGIDFYRLLGTGDGTKTDEFSKFQTAFDPPPSLAEMLHFFG